MFGIEAGEKPSLAEKKGDWVHKDRGRSWPKKGLHLPFHLVCPARGSPLKRQQQILTKRPECAQCLGDPSRSRQKAEQWMDLFIHHFMSPSQWRQISKAYVLELTCIFHRKDPFFRSPLEACLLLVYTLSQQATRPGFPAQGKTRSSGSEWCGKDREKLFL